MVARRIPNIIDTAKTYGVTYLKLIGSATTSYFRMFHSDIDLVYTIQDKELKAQFQSDIFDIVNECLEGDDSEAWSPNIDFLNTDKFEHMKSEPGVILI